jgi:hypothetical protein
MVYRASGGDRAKGIRLVLVGYGGAGKTTLKNRVLLNRSCLPTGLFFISFIPIFQFDFEFDD